ncbi:LCP family protein [Paenibacillus sp. P96]|uniref:LCP family protein n=1 Tax=Paenibacillus zeirhizosphaerae TaxID=2987519 RepID=A0ABT9FNX5_9BACL|nr:LCP family protein [Paenibacillus sp. P96]MDP4096437.1 LCP family protein [Paenibacillus sp. P96]
MERRSADKRRKRKKKKRNGWWIGLLILILLAGGAYLLRKPLTALAFDWFISPTLESKLQQSYQPREGGNMPAPEPVVYQDKPFSVLLLGSDKRPYEKTRGRSDTIMFAAVRPKESRVLLISVPRDTYVQVIGRDADHDGADDYDKLTHAFAYGGEEMSINTVENFLDHDIDYYATINFQAIQDVVNAVGGVSLPIVEDMENKNPAHVKFKIEGGKPVYNGEEAMYYVRYREDSDFNRTKRQQIFLNALADKVLTINGITQIPELLDIMGQNFQTDMQPSFIVDLGKQVLTQSKPQISSFTIMGEGLKINGTYYDQADEEDLEYAQSLIENWMDPNTTSATLMLPDRQEIE